MNLIIQLITGIIKIELGVDKKEEQEIDCSHTRRNLQGNRKLAGEKREKREKVESNN